MKPASVAEKAPVADLWFELARAYDKGFALKFLAQCKSVTAAMRAAASSFGCYYDVANTAAHQPKFGP